jgi:predicted dehydrogenase
LNCPPAFFIRIAPTQFSTQSLNQNHKPFVKTRREFLNTLTSLSVAAIGARADAAETLPEIIRIAIIGLEGHYGEVNSAARVLPRIRISAISDPRADALKKARFPNAARYQNHQKLLDGEKLDIVCVCGENATRAKILQACAEKRLPILSEKPLALSYSELTAVKRAITKNKTPLSMLLTMRGSPPYLAMREIVQSGAIGEVVSMDAQKSYKLGERPEWMHSRKTFGGIIPFIGIHMIDLMRWISGREFTEAAAFHSNVSAPTLREMENNSALIFKLDNNGSGSLRMDYLRPETAPTHGDDRLRIVGTKGIVEYQNNALTLLTGEAPPRKIETLPPARSICIDFIESIYLKKAPIITEEEIFRVSEIVLKLRDAADHHRIVPL